MLPNHYDLHEYFGHTYYPIMFNALQVIQTVPSTLSSTMAKPPKLQIVKLVTAPGQQQMLKIQGCTTLHTIRMFCCVTYVNFY